MCLGGMDGPHMAGQDGRAGQRQPTGWCRWSGGGCGTLGEPWAVKGFLLPVCPGLMPCQVLLQIAELQLARNWAYQGGMLLARRITTLGETPVSATPAWPSPFKLCFVLAMFPREEASDGFVLVLDALGQGPGRRQECLTQQSRRAASPQQLQQ